MNINVWTNFSKRVNSTLQPTGGTQISVVLKENCSLENPVFIVSTPITDYTYVEAFGHYYFVSDIVNINATQSEIHCGLDPMATYKSEIGATSAYVVYDETANSDIQDSRLAVHATPTVTRATTSAYDNFSPTGSVIVTATGEDKTHVYSIGANDIQKLIPDVNTQIQAIFAQDWTPVDSFIDIYYGIISAIKQIVGSSRVADNITDIRWIPFSYTGSGGSGPIKVGCYTTTVTGYEMAFGVSRLHTYTASVNIPWQFSDWRNAEPYSQVYIRIPFVGVINIPASALKGNSSLSLFSSLDALTGDIAMDLYAGSQIIGSYGASTSAKIPIGNNAPSIGQIVNSFLSVPSMVAGKAQGIASGLSEAFTTAFNNSPQSVGGVSSAAAAGLNGNLECYVVTHGTVVAPSSVSSVMGTPAMAVKTLGNLSGYIQCSGASVSGSMHAGDREAINGMLNSGFFYE